MTEKREVLTENINRKKKYDKNFEKAKSELEISKFQASAKSIYDILLEPKKEKTVRL